MTPLTTESLLERSPSFISVIVDFPMVVKKLTRCEDSITLNHLPVLGSMRLSKMMAVDNMVFAIGYEQELEGKLNDRKFQTSLRDKELGELTAMVL